MLCASSFEATELQVRTTCRVQPPLLSTPSPRRPRTQHVQPPPKRLADARHQRLTLRAVGDVGGAPSRAVAGSLELSHGGGDLVGAAGTEVDLPRAVAFR